MDTKRSLYEIEVALAESPFFSFKTNIIAFNVCGLSATLPIFHECDMLLVSKSGYLTEIEIKRSFEDFKKDFKKSHKHEDMGLIKNFWFCVPKSIYQKILDSKILDDNFNTYFSFILYDEDLRLELRTWSEFATDVMKEKVVDRNYRKLFLEQILEIARLGSMRVIGLKKKLIEKEEKI